MTIVAISDEDNMHWFLSDPLRPEAATPVDCRDPYVKSHKCRTDQIAGYSAEAHTHCEPDAVPETETGAGLSKESQVKLMVSAGS